MTHLISQFLQRFVVKMCIRLTLETTKLIYDRIVIKAFSLDIFFKVTDLFN